jgi:hypothetical protein
MLASEIAWITTDRDSLVDPREVHSLNAAGKAALMGDSSWEYHFVKAARIVKFLVAERGLQTDLIMPDSPSMASLAAMAAQPQGGHDW